MIPTAFKTDGRYLSLKALAAAQDTRVRGIADNDENKVAILFAYETESSAFYFTTGYFDNLRRAVSYSRAVFQNEDIEMNIFKNNKLFPNIRGVMLKEKRITLTMSGRVNIVEMREGGDARCEIYFTDHEKTAVVNRSQLLIIADIYGPETDAWKDKQIALFGEEGNWFGKHQWGVRVDDKMTRAASKKPVSKNGKVKPPAEDRVLDALLEGLDEHNAELDAALAKREKEQQDKALAELIWNEQDATQEDLFPA